MDEASGERGARGGARDAEGARGAEGASPGERQPYPRTRRAQGAARDPQGTGRGAHARAVLYALEMLATGRVYADGAERVAAACGVGIDLAGRAILEARDRLDWSASADPDSVRAAWVASVSAVAVDAMERGKHEAALQALEMRARAAGIIAAPAAAQVAVSVGAAGALDASGLARELEAAQDELRRLAAARASRALPPPGAAQGLPEIDRAREGGGNGDGGGAA